MTRRVSMSVNNRRPIDRPGSNPGRALGGLILGSLGVLAWVAIIYALVWIASVPA